VDECCLFTWSYDLKKRLDHKLLNGINISEAILHSFMFMMTMSELVSVAFRLSLLEFVSQESVHDSNMYPRSLSDMKARLHSSISRSTEAKNIIVSIQCQVIWKIREIWTQFSV
jgi:hypothetical protein